MTPGDNDIAMLWSCIWACALLIPAGAQAVLEGKAHARTFPRKRQAGQGNLRAIERGML